jgi:hypothetical protein
MVELGSGSEVRVFDAEYSPFFSSISDIEVAELGHGCLFFPILRSLRRVDGSVWEFLVRSFTACLCYEFLAASSRKWPATCARPLSRASWNSEHVHSLLTACIWKRICYCWQLVTETVKNVRIA